ncbi:MAG: hypothetical protein LBP41_03625, partial [Holosporaceae bacterium]|nr:hypothetical protein [Holosporaceae bacterium]
MRLENALIARICHDLITPFNAINLGIEAYEASGDASLLLHMKESAAKANTILKFMREMYSEKSDAFRHSLISLNSLIADFLRNSGLLVDLKFDGDDIPHVIAQVILHNVAVAKESMPFGGTIRCHISKDFSEITLSCVGKDISAPDLNLCSEPNHKNVMLHNLMRLLGENGWQLNIFLQGVDMFISEKKR